jgi:FkbM family methyltransferase
MKQWARGQLQSRLGLDIVRFPSTSIHTFNGFLLRLLRELEIDCVLDVGANVGQYGANLRAIGYEGSIVSFEPVDASYRSLSTRAAGDDGWRTVPIALGATGATGEMNVTASSVLASLRRPLLDGPEWIRPQMAVVDMEAVEVSRLDAVFEEVTGGARQAFLKLDTQGWDLEVIAGAAGCLDHVVAMQSELSVIPLYEGTPTWLEALAELRSLGFQPTWMAPVQLDGPIRPIELDCILVRA